MDIVEQLREAWKTSSQNSLLISQAADEIERLMKQRDELLAAAEAIEINSEECLDFDECTAMLVPIDDYHKLIEAIASVKGAE